MSSRLPNLRPGEHILKVVSWRLTDEGDYQIRHEVIVSGYRPIWRTFRSQLDLQSYLEVLTGKQLTEDLPALLDSLKGTRFMGLVKAGKGYFMNLTQIIEVINAPIFNSSNPVSDCQTTVCPNCKKMGGQDARQASSDLP